MPVDAISERLIAERDDLQVRASGVKRTAMDQNRDLTDNDRELLVQYRNRITAIDEQLKITTDDYAMSDDIASSLAKYNGGRQIRTENPWEKSSPGQVLWDYLHRGTDPDAGSRIASFQRFSNARAAQHMGTTAENTVAVAGGFGGVLVSQIQGPIIDLNWQGMPFVTALGYTDLPTANTFMRPRLIDPDFDTAAGPQAGGKEKAELPSKKWDIVADPIGLAGVGNYINLSIQAETMVPGALDIVINQLNRRTTRGIEKTAVAKLTSASKVIAGGSTAVEIQAAFAEAYVAVWESTGNPPTWIAYGPQGAGLLMGLTDLAGRPLFPSLGPVNAPGSQAVVTGGGGSINGMTPVLTPAIADASFYVGNSLGLEVYVHRLPLLQAIEPSILGRQLAAAALVGTYQAPTTEADASGTPPAAYEGIVKITTS